MTEPLFDLSDEYESMLDRGLGLSGESMEYFIRGRLDGLRRWLPSPPPRDVLDFGCGLGHTTVRLGGLFPHARITGVDTSMEALSWAREHNSGSRLRYIAAEALPPEEAAYDLVYLNGVLHHIEPSRRNEAARRLATSLRPGGQLAVFENNPWNPGARLVMARIPFDRDARMLWPHETRRLLRGCGLEVWRLRSLFYFPRVLRWLRFLERPLGRLPLGAQYAVMARKPAGTGPSPPAESRRG